MISQAFLHDLIAALGSDRVLQDEESLARFSQDAFARWRISAPVEAPLAGVVARPVSTGEVAALVSLANRHNVPVVPRGGGTGVMGAAVPRRGGLVLDLKGLDRILDISADDRTARVQAGVVLEDLEQALSQHGLILGHDPYSVPIATVGGTISTNSVGYRAARYGSMGAQVLGLEVVLPTGEVLRTRATSLPSIGPDLNHLFIGSEGVFGVIIEATLCVFPTPEARSFQTFAFPDFPSGFAAVQQLAALGMRPAVFDLTEEEGRRGDPDSGPSVTLYLAFEGYHEEVEAHQGRAAEVCRRHGADNLGPLGAEEYWRTRHDSAYRYRNELRSGPAAEARRRRWGRGGWDYLHVTLPASQVVPFYRCCREHLAPQGVIVREAAVWTAPERFSMILAGDESDEASQERVARASDWVLQLAQDLGGTMEYCHGVGLKLERLLEREMGVGLEVVRRLKRALDPNDIMNPGKLGV